EPGSVAVHRFPGRSERALSKPYPGRPHSTACRWLPEAISRCKDWRDPVRGKTSSELRVQPSVPLRMDFQWGLPCSMAGPCFIMDSDHRVLGIPPLTQVFTHLEVVHESFPGIHSRHSATGRAMALAQPKPQTRTRPE